MRPRALLLCAVLLPGALRGQGPQVGQPAPDFGLELLAGGKARLSEFRGHPVLVNFWATWCKPCREEMPGIVSSYSSQRDAGLIVLAVNLADQENRKDVRRFVRELGMDFPVLLDDRGKVRRVYALTAVPTSIFIDTAGVVRTVDPGPMTPEMLRRGLESVIPGS